MHTGPSGETHRGEIKKCNTCQYDLKTLRGINKAAGKRAKARNHGMIPSGNRLPRSKRRA